ncbi:MAG: glycosyltransferase family 4 protein [Pseudomonadota bacterium]
MTRLLCLTSHADALISVRPEAESFIGLAAAGVSMHVMTQADTPYVQRMRDANIRVASFEPRGKISPRAIRQIRDYVIANAIDIVYAFNNRAISNAIWACSGLDVKLITYRGQTGNVERFDPSVLLTHRHPRVDGIICVADAIRRYLRPRIAPRVPIATVYKGHDLRWYQDAPASRRDFQIPDDAIVIGCVANNRPRKGVEYLIAAFRKLASDKRLHLMLIGTGMDAQTLMAMPSDPGLRQRIHLLGRRDDVGALTQLFDIAVLPALRREGLPKTLIEAMAYGVPCVGTETGGIPELIADAESGFVVPVADADALAAAISRLTDDRMLRRRFGEAGRQRIVAHFSPDGTVRDTLRFFDQLTETASALPG